jgi:hypothetical protein
MFSFYLQLMVLFKIFYVNEATKLVKENESVENP